MSTSQHTLEREGATLHYELHGDSGPAVLLIQGVGVAGCGWRPQVEALREKSRVLTFDNRGLGQSTLPRGMPLSIEQMSDDAHALARAAGWDGCHVAGHSMGGVIAQCLALRHPGFVRSLALLCTVADGADAAHLTPQKLWLGLRGRIGTPRARRRAFLKMILSPREFASADLDATAARFAECFGRDIADQPSIVMQQLGAMGRYDARPGLPSLRDTPALVVSATHDIVTPARHGRELASLLPGARYVELPDTAHAATITRADEVNRLLLDFIFGA